MCSFMKIVPSYQLNIMKAKENVVSGFSYLIISYLISYLTGFVNLFGTLHTIQYYLHSQSSNKSQFFISGIC
jgi:hypothetical protein